jgi:hypothetical protein
MAKFIGQVAPHMEVLASDGQAVGKVDHEDGQNRIKLAKDKDAQHHWINWDMVDSVEAGKLRLNITSTALQHSWKNNPASHIRGPFHYGS